MIKPKKTVTDQNIKQPLKDTTLKVGWLSGITFKENWLFKYSGNVKYKQACT